MSYLRLHNDVAIKEVHAMPVVSYEFEVTRIERSLDRVGVERLRSRIRTSMRSGAQTHLLDLRPLAVLDSQTLAALIRVLRFVRESGGSVGLIVDQEHFLRILSITALDRIFPIFRDEAAAAAVLQLDTAIPA
jgi:anti-anti-sigma factor